MLSNSPVVQIHQFLEDLEALVAPGNQHHPGESKECSDEGRQESRLLCSMLFQNSSVNNFTLGPGRPIPVSPWIPDGPGSPLSPYKMKRQGCLIKDVPLIDIVAVARDKDLPTWLVQISCFQVDPFSSDLICANHRFFPL